MTTFRELHIADDLADILETHHITSPFPIQEEAIPLAIKGKDLLGQAKTGTGKTLAYGLPILQQIGTPAAHVLTSLIVVPTRELATQVHDDLAELAAAHDVRIASISGGHAYEDQIAALQAGSDIVVGTPGRLLDLNKQGILDLSGIRHMVLDEADKMLDLGFLPDVERIFAQLPEQRQTMLFSATLPGPVIGLSRRFMTHPVHIQVADPDEGIVQGNIQQFVYRAHPLDKPEIIARILQAPGRGRTIIFTRTKRAAARLADDLVDRGFKAVPVHGDLTQDVRERNLNAFRSGTFDVLVATDVAARGIDVEDVTHVINHSIPEDEKDYLHRIGRTGRAGKTGIAVTFVDWQDTPRWRLVNEALQFGQEEPTETYSTSPHLYADLHIPEQATGRLASAPPAAHSDRPERGRSGERRGPRERERTDRRRGRASAAEDHPRRARRDRDHRPADSDTHGDAGRTERSGSRNSETHSRHEHTRSDKQTERRDAGRGRGRRNDKVVLKAHKLEHGALAAATDPDGASSK